MSAEATLVTALLTNGDLTDVLTGGIYSYKALGEKGLVPHNPACSAASTLTTGLYLMNPCLVVNVRNDRPDYQRSDTDTQETSWTGDAGLWFYQERGHDDITDAAELVYAQLQSRVFAGLGLCQLVSVLDNQTAPEFDNVTLRRDNYRFKRIKRT